MKKPAQGNRIRLFLKGARSSWTMLAQTTVWVAGAVAAFLLPPPTVGSDHTLVRFAQFAVTILVGVLLLAGLRWQRTRHALRWALVSICALILGGALFFAYQILLARWTTSYNLQRLVVGGTYTEMGRQYHEEHPELRPDDLVMSFAGRVENIWTQESLAQRHWILTAFYVLALPMFTVSLLSIVQALRCSGG